VKKIMKEDYLWDRSGEPDPELQKLEEILGTLKYKPRPLQIPDDLRIGHRRRFFPAMAIAASIALFALLLGLGFYFNRRPSAPQILANTGSQPDRKTNEPERAIAPEKEASRATVVKDATGTSKRQRESNRTLVPVKRRPLIRRETSQPELTAEELAEKEQLLTALRLVSAKLNVAQRRTQGAPQVNTIRNQRKIG
jgi:hypothetical protein